MSMDTEYIAIRMKRNRGYRRWRSMPYRRPVCAGNSQCRSGRMYVFKKGGTFHVR